jgi:putative component of membrane protein insertase Oxa1/YidC/SpoIIIJ protein YidD
VFVVLTSLCPLALAQPGRPNPPFQPVQPGRPNPPFQPGPGPGQTGANDAAGCAACGGAFLFLIILGVVVSIITTVIWVFVLIWVAKDARSRGMDNGACARAPPMPALPRRLSESRRLWQQAPAREPPMPALPRRLRDPRSWLLLFGGLAVLAVLDTLRAPGRQLTGQTYVGAVHVYQEFGRPALRGRVVCRFHPSCSDYSIEAVRRHGIRRGLVLTGERLSRCNHTTPPGTDDPVPPCDDGE